MQRFFRQWITDVSSRTKRWQRSLVLLFVSWLCITACVGLIAYTASAQNDVKKLEDQQIRQYTLPKPPPQAPVYKPRPAPASAPSKSSPKRQQETAPSQPAPSSSQPSAPAPSSNSTSKKNAQETAPAATPKTENKPEGSPEQPEIPPATVPEDNTPTSQYILEFNRSPVVGYRLRLQGTYSTAWLRFTRPRSWKLQSVKALVRFQHSPALIASRSNLTVRVNDTSIGSVPLNRPETQVGQVLLDVPPQRLQDFNDISIVAQQHNTANCKEEDSGDPTLWTEILPDSKLIFNFKPQPIALDFSRYPYPFLDTLSLDPNRVVYLRPRQVNESWLTATARYSANLGRLADFRPLETRLVGGLDQVQANERLVIIGTPEEQPALQSLKLPFKITKQQILDGSGSALPPDVGVLMLTTTLDSGVPILVATGNGSEGVLKAVQFLVQSKDSKIGTGGAIVVSKVTDVASPPPRQWPRYLPDKNSFKLSDLKVGNGKPFQEVTVRGASAPPIDIDFRALPNDRFKRGSSMNVVYSYGPQVNPRTSVMEVLLDGVFIGGARLSDENGAIRQSTNINLPENLVKPSSKLQIAFRLNSREPGTCGKVIDQQLTATLHTDTSFNLNRESSVELPDLKLLQFGFPFAAPQDLSNTAIVVPDSPSNAVLTTLLQFSERLGRLSLADSIKLNAYTIGTFPAQERQKQNVVGIGTRKEFPFQEAFQSGGFNLKDVFSRQWQQNQIQTLPDPEGVIKEIISPWKNDRVLLALSAQTENGLEHLQDLFKKDFLFFQLDGDTGLIARNGQGTSAYDPDAYDLEFLQNAQQRRIEDTDLLSKVTRWLQEHWFFLPTGIILLALVLYGISQLYLKRVADKEKK